MANKDVDSIYEIGKSTPEFKISHNPNSIFWPKETLLNWVGTKEDVLLVAEEKGEIMGFVICRTHKKTSTASLDNIWVSPRFRGKDLSKKLLNYLLKELKKREIGYVFGLVKEDNLSSIKFFEKNNFNKGYNFYWVEKEL